ncbi:MAG: carboxypeptidase regulatory-like domain-containing protein, partial [Planctomycetota bacterium]
MSKLQFRFLVASTIASCFGALACPTIGFAQDPANAQPEALAVPAPATSSPSDSVSKVGSLNHHQWLHLSADGSFWGTLGTPAGESQIRQSGVEVALIQKGQRVASVTTAEDGSFRFTDIQPGVYSLIAHNPSTLALMSLTLLDASAGKHLPTGIQIRTLTPATDRVVSLIRGGSIPRSLAPIQLDKDPVGQDRSFFNSGRVAIDNDGGINGRVRVPGENVDMSNTQIYLTHSGNEIAKTRADRDGNYRFDNIPPGNYGFVASGPAGIAAMGFVAVGKGSGGAESSTSISQDG